MFGIGEIVGAGMQILDKVIPDPKEREAAKLKLEELRVNGELDEIKIHADDRASARQMQAQTRSYAPSILAGVVLLSAFAIIIYTLSGNVSLTGESGLLIGTIVGGVMGYVTQVLNYYFGSSSGSAEKNNTIKQLQQLRK